MAKTQNSNAINKHIEKVSYPFSRYFLCKCLFYGCWDSNTHQFQINTIFTSKHYSKNDFAFSIYEIHVLLQVVSKAWSQREICCTIRLFCIDLFNTLFDLIFYIFGSRWDSVLHKSKLGSLHKWISCIDNVLWGNHITARMLWEVSYKWEINTNEYGIMIKVFR